MMQIQTLASALIYNLQACCCKQVKGIATPSQHNITIPIGIASFFLSSAWLFYNFHCFDEVYTNSYMCTLPPVRASANASAIASARASLLDLCGFGCGLGCGGGVCGLGWGFGWGFCWGRCCGVGIPSKLASLLCISGSYSSMRPQKTLMYICEIWNDYQAGQ